MSPPVPGHHGGSSGSSSGGPSSGGNNKSTSTRDYSPNLGSIDSQAPVSPSHNTNWDTETDHILYFFLGGGDAHHSLPDFTSSVTSGGGGGGGGGGTPAVTPGTAGNRRSNKDITGKSSSNEQDIDEDEDDDPIPPTPSVNFYAHHTGHHSGSSSMDHHLQSLPGTAMTSSSSSSSLSSVAAPFGGPTFHHQIPIAQQQKQHQQRLQHQQHHGDNAMQRDSPIDHSPISPAALIGHGYENLMLPPPSRVPPGNATKDSASSDAQDSKNNAAVKGNSGSDPSSGSTMPHIGGSDMQQGQQEMTISEQERHLAWLRDLNAMAKASTGSGSAGATAPPMGPPNQQSPQQLQGGSSAGGIPMSHTTMTHNPALVAAYPGAPLAPNHPAAVMFPPGATAAMMLHPHHHAAAMAAAAAAAAASAKPPVESAEKRAKRLERNRESARKSRRRKKERLATLEAQVNKLHGEIEVERRLQVNAMIPGLRRLRQNAGVETLQQIIRETGSDTEIMRAVLDYQHTAFKQVILPRYHKVMIWFTLQNESFFFEGKEKYSGVENTKGARTAATKISSKQIGEELTNGTKTEKPPKRRVTFKEDDTADRPNLTPYANDAARVWPLFCYEMSFSVDQEERFLTTHKRVQDVEGLSNSRVQMAAAVQTGDSLKEAVESLSRVIGTREDRSMVGILSQQQVASYRDWTTANRQRCASIIERNRAAGNSLLGQSPMSLATDSALHEICRRLNEVLQISNKSEK